MKIDILTIFPEMFTGFVNSSIIKRAIDKNKVVINVHDFRKYSTDPHKRVDDYGYGGGQGMVLMPQPIFDAVDDIKENDTKVILLTPQGKKYNQKMAHELSREKKLLFICGHYEGFDERIRTLADIEVSIGDYVLTGGELASEVIVDSVVRLLPGVIKDASWEQESFSNNLLDYPVYTRPADFRGMRVPDVLLSGHHANIEQYRLEESLKRTRKRRPDLLEKE